MKIKRQKRVFYNANLNKSNSKKGFIFVSNNFIKTSNKPISINKTKLYYKDNFNLETIILKKKNIQPKDISLKFNIDSSDIIEIINIYKNILFIVVLNYNCKLENYKENIFLDLFYNTSESIYNDVFKYNSNNSYLNRELKDKKQMIKLKLRDVYYYLIGYI